MTVCMSGCQVLSCGNTAEGRVDISVTQLHLWEKF